MGARPRVTIVAHKIHDHGGMERALAELIRHGADRIDFTVISIQLDESLRDLVRWKRVRGPLRPAPALFASFFVVAQSLVARSPSDLVHTMGAIVPSRADFVSVQFCHAAYWSQPGSGRAAGTGAARRLNSTIDRHAALTAERHVYRPGRVRLFGAASAGIGRELARHYPGIPAVETPNGVDLARFRPDAEARAAKRASLSLGENDLAALFLGGDWQRKGLEPAIRGVALARRRGAHQLSLHVVGAGDRVRFAALTTDLGVSDHVFFHGTTTEPEAWFRAADVHVLPSNYEAFPLVALEAVASGVPLVATPVSGIEELVRDGREGLLVSRSPEAIADALVRLTNDRNRHDAMRAAARERAHSYTWERSGDTVLTAYERLLSSS